MIQAFGKDRHMRWLGYFLSPLGRIGRRRFWLATVVSALVFVASIAALGYTVASNVGDFVDPKTMTIDGHRPGAARALLIVAPLTAVVVCGAVYIFVAACGRRYNDRGRSSWWVFASFVPILGPIAMLIELGFVSGTRGRNRYGPPPGSRYAGVDQVFGRDEVVIAPERGRVSNTIAVLTAWIASLVSTLVTLVLFFQQH